MLDEIGKFDPAWEPAAYIIEATLKAPAGWSRDDVYVRTKYYADARQEGEAEARRVMDAAKKTKDTKKAGR